VREGAHVHDAGAQLRELALGELRVVLEQGGRDDHPEHGVAEELEPLVGGQAAVLVRVRAVRQRPLEHLRFELDTEGGLEAVLVLHERSPSASRMVSPPAEESSVSRSSASPATAGVMRWRCRRAARAIPSAISAPPAEPWQTTTSPATPSSTAAASCRATAPRGAA